MNNLEFFNNSGPVWVIGSCLAQWLTNIILEYCKSSFCVLQLHPSVQFRAGEKPALAGVKQLQQQHPHVCVSYDWLEEELCDAPGTDGPQGIEGQEELWESRGGAGVQGVHVLL